MIRRPPRSTRTDTLFPYTTLFRSLRAVDLGGHATLGDVAVGTDRDVQEASVLAGGQRLGPVVIDRRRQVGDLDRRAAGPGLAFAVVEAHQRVLVGDLERSSAERRLGDEWVSTCGSRWVPTN